MNMSQVKTMKKIALTFPHLKKLYLPFHCLKKKQVIPFGEHKKF